MDDEVELVDEYDYDTQQQVLTLHLKGVHKIKRSGWYENAKDPESSLKRILDGNI